MVRPTRRLIVLLAAGLGAAAAPAAVGARAWPVWALSLAVCAVAAALDASRIPRRRTIALSVDAPRELRAGEQATAWIEISIPTRRLSRLDVMADLSSDLVFQPALTAEYAEPGVRVPIALHPLRRGRADIEAVRLRIAGPWGLMSGESRIPVERTIAVLPHVRGARSAPLSYDEHRDGRAGVKVERFDGDGSEFDALREFRVGDDHRTIDWKASARHRSLLRRQFRAERDHQVILALDCGRLMAARLHGVPKLDHAVGAALRLAHVALRTGDMVGVYAFDERPRLREAPRSGIPTHAHLLRVLATLEAREVETNFTLGLVTLLQTLRRRSLILVLTDFADTVSAELLIENLRRTGHRHVVVFAALADPLLAAIETSPPVDRLALHRAVVAGTIRRERAVVLERLRRLGIHPIEASADQLGAEMISRYLDLKRREVA